MATSGVAPNALAVRAHRAAVYARKSTDDSDKHAEARSTTRQIERATAYAQARGWTVDPAHIFTDENTSGAEWKQRPGSPPRSS